MPNICLEAIKIVFYMIVTAVTGVFIVFLAVYAVANPDNDAWYGYIPKDSVEAGQLYGDHLFNKQQDAQQANAEHLVHIHERFTNWFLWGFIQLCVFLLVILLEVAFINPCNQAG